MVFEHIFYEGTDYGFDPTFGDSPSTGENFLGFNEANRVPAALLGVATDPRSANQLKALSDKISTGAKTIELTPVQQEIFESIPTQHLVEINRLRKLSGVDLTLHGPLVEPTGVRQQGWTEADRTQSENQMWSAVERGHNMDPKGNLVITFHSSNGLPHPETITKDEKTGKNVLQNFWVVDERTGQFSALTPSTNYLTGKPQETDVEALKRTVEKQNEDAWFRALQHVNFNAHQGAQIVNTSTEIKRKLPEEIAKEVGEVDLKKYYNEFLQGKTVEIESKLTPATKELFKDEMNRLAHGDIYLRDAYQEFQTLFNQAYETTLTSGNTADKEKLDNFKKEIEPKLEFIKDPAKLDVLADEIVRGVNVLRSIDAPQNLKPLRDFAMEKASETFSGIAFRAYDKFKDTAPIISIENPPAGMGLSKAEDIKELIEVSREKFTKRAMEERGLSESEAKEQAEKLIGATWDVGHINLLRKYGYNKEDIEKETGKIAPFVKHVHLSDNFGFEHTELPMGMGNVSTKKAMELIGEYNKKAKKIIEAGNWYQYFQKAPFVETLSAFGSPIYPARMAPYWNQTANRGGAGTYFAGYGQNPDIHHSIYGAGFSNLPVELGGQQFGGRSRLSGNPME